MVQTDPEAAKQVWMWSLPGWEMPTNPKHLALSSLTEERLDLIFKKNPSTPRIGATTSHILLIKYTRAVHSSCTKNCVNLPTLDVA